MIRVVCGCGRVFKAEDRHAGRRTRCPACGANLVIGQSPKASSSAGDLDDLPSWWYPSDPAAAGGARGVPAPGQRDSESMPTAIIEPATVPERAEPSEVPAASRATRERANRHAAPPPARLWTVAGALAASAVVAVGVLSWMHAAVPGRGDASRPRVPASGTRPREARGGAERGSPVERVPPPAGPDGRIAPPARRLQLLVPAYIYPAGEGRIQWNRLIDAAGKVGLVLVVNPDSGPGKDRNPDYASIIAAAARRGVTLVGYVNTAYGTRSAALIKDDIDAWVRNYPRIGGFFVDQQPADARHSDYFADIAAYARGKIRDAVVIGNPGVPCDESYLSRRAADVVCVFAKPDGFEPFELPATLKDYDASRVAALIYQIGDVDAMRRLLREAIIKRVGYVFVTDGHWPNPWGQLPSYWDEEVEALSRIQ